MNRSLVIALCFVLFLSACAPSPESVQMAIANTQVALQAQWTSTPAPTPIPFSELDLEDILIKQGDLPSGLETAQIRTSVPKRYEKLSKPDYVIYQQLTSNQKGVGFVLVMIYEELSKTEEAFQVGVDDLGKENIEAIDGLGDAATLLSIKEFTPLTTGQAIDVKITELIFQHCHAVVDIIVIDRNDPEGITAYAERLDKRLEQIVCR